MDGFVGHGFLQSQLPGVVKDKVDDTHTCISSFRLWASSTERYVRVDMKEELFVRLYRLIQLQNFKGRTIRMP